MHRSPLAAAAALGAGVLITLMGLAPLSGTPLLVIAGFTAIGYAVWAVTARVAPSAGGVTGSCHGADHAGCLDSPDCACGCHRERVELRMPAL